MKELLTIVTTMLPRPTPEHLPLLMGIDGPGGAGKSTFAAALARRLQRERISVTIVRMDDFFLPSTQRPTGCGADKPLGGDLDWQRLRDQVLIPLAHHQEDHYIATERPHLTANFHVTNADPTARLPDWHIQRMLL